MTSRRLFFCLILLISGVSGRLASAAADPEATSYITAQDLSPQLLTPPPAENSAPWLKELKAVMTAQQHISKSDLASFKAEQRVKPELLTKILGRDVTREHLPKTFALLDRVLGDTKLIVDADKQFWHTRRPYLTDSRVKLLIDPLDNNPAYPSGHACETRVIAEVLGMLFPEHLAALRERADLIAWHRVEAGVHYPVDLEGGRMLALLIVGAFTQSDDFQDDLMAARDEIASPK